MGYVQSVQSNMLPVRAGALTVGQGADQRQVPISAFALQKTSVTVALFKAFLVAHAAQPWARFEQTPDGYLKMTHVAATKEALPAFVPVAGEPIPLSRIVKIPSPDEYQAHFEGYKAGLRTLLLADESPATEVNWFEAAYFAASVGGRLPTLEEREYAARAGREGDDICGVAGDGKLTPHNAQWSPEGHKKDGPVKVGSFGPNPWGFQDLAGNVWEWVALAGDLQGDSGGSWAYGIAGYLAAAFCVRSYPDGRNYDLGFRVARSLPQDSIAV